MTNANIQINVRTPSPKVAILDIHGEINSYAENAIMDAYTQSSSAGANAIILNFEGLDYMNSSGIGSIIAAHTTYSKGGGLVKLTGLNSNVHNLFVVTKLIDIFDVYDSLDEAIDSFVKQNLSK